MTKKNRIFTEVILATRLFSSLFWFLYYAGTSAIFLQAIYSWWKEGQTVCEGSDCSETSISTQDITACVSLILAFVIYYPLSLIFTELFYWKLCYQVRAYSSSPSHFPFLYCGNIDYWRFLTDTDKRFQFPTAYYIFNILILHILSIATHLLIAALLESTNDPRFKSYLVLAFVNIFLSGMHFFYGTILCYCNHRHRYKPVMTRIELEEIEDRDADTETEEKTQIKQFIP